MSGWFPPLVDTQRATTRGLTGPKALDKESQILRAQRFVEAANRVSEQPFARALSTPAFAAARKRAADFPGDDVILFGIGGSALGPRVLYEALRPSSPWEGKRLHVLDHLDPSACEATITEGWERGAHFCVISKSGDTTETMALAAILDGVATRTSKQPYGSARVTIVTNEITEQSPGETPIRTWANAIGAPCIDMPYSLGGRYSVLSAVGLLPATLLGYDVEALVEGGRQMLSRLTKVRTGAEVGPSGIGHEALELASTLVGLDLEKGCGTQVVFPYLHALERFGAWFVQLWAESLGKQKRGGHEVSGPSGPVAGVGPTDQHSFAQLLLQGRPDKVVLLLDVQSAQEGGSPISPGASFDGKLDVLRARTLGQILSTECFATELALGEVGRPTVAIRTDGFDARVLGSLFVLFEATTYLAGMMYEVDPYDQPGVQLIKRYIKDGLATGAGDGSAPEDTLGREWARNGGFPRQLPRKKSRVSE